MKYYFYKARNHKRDKGLNRRISVYTQMKDRSFYHVGERSINANSYKGDYAIACEIISDAKGHRMTECGRFLESKKITVISLPV